MQNRNRGGFEVATAFNNDTPLMGPKEMVRVQSESLTMITDVVNWRKGKIGRMIKCRVDC